MMKDIPFEAYKKFDCRLLILNEIFLTKAVLFGNLVRVLLVHALIHRLFMQPLNRLRPVLHQLSG